MTRLIQKTKKRNMSFLRALQKRKQNLEITENDTDRITGR